MLKIKLGTEMNCHTYIKKIILTKHDVPRFPVLAGDGGLLSCGGGHLPGGPGCVNHRGRHVPCCLLRQGKGFYKNKDVVLEEFFFLPVV